MSQLPLFCCDISRCGEGCTATILSRLCNVDWRMMITFLLLVMQGDYSALLLSQFTCVCFRVSTDKSAAPVPLFAVNIPASYQSALLFIGNECTKIYDVAGLMLIL